MLVQISRLLFAVAISALGLWVAWGQAQPQTQTPAQQGQPQWKDRAEYDLYAAAAKEADPKKALDILTQWSQKYPATAMKQLRDNLYLRTYQKLGDAKQMYQTARNILSEFPNDFEALYAVTLLTPALTASPAPPESLDTGEKAARGLLGQLDTVFAAEKKPAQVTDEQWKKTRLESEALAHRTLGWTAMQRKDYAAAEKEFEQELKLNPLDAEAAYWLGSVMIAQKNPDKYSHAIYYIARAACYAGPGALPDAGRKQADAYLRKFYTQYHGQDPTGLEALCNQAKTQAAPASDFKILSEAEIKAGHEQQLMQSNPALAFWLKLKEALQAENGDQYFDSGMKGALIPPEGQPALKGTLVSLEPAKNPKTLVLAVSDSSTPEVTLRFVNDEGQPIALPGRAEPGTALEFRGIATSFAKQPFNVTFDVERKNLSGWPAPTPARKAPPRKGVRKK